MTLRLPATPSWLREANEKAIAAAETRHLIELADYQCQGKGKRGAVCGWLAWSKTRVAQLVLRPKLAAFGQTKAEGDWVLCPDCAAAYDRKHPAKKARRSA